MSAPVRVLVCDDQVLVRTGLSTIIDAQPDLEVAGECGDGLSAVELAGQLRPDIVVMDVRMPVLDGIEATRRLAGPGVEHPVKVLVVTTFNLDEYVYEALRAGASGFLLKDASGDQLAQAVRVVAAGDALLAPGLTMRLITEYARVTAGPRRAAGVRVEELTPRETEVLCQVALGLSNEEIAQRLTIAEETVKTHVGRILMKLGLRDRTQAAVHAYESGLVVPGAPSA